MTALLIIDPQNDFMDIPGAALPVPGANDDMNRLAKFLLTHISEIQELFITLDSHHVIDIAHPGFWLLDSGEHPGPFTQIRLQDVLEGKYRATVKEQFHLQYLENLEKKGKTHTIWPEHCLIGTWGYAVQSNLMDAVKSWEKHWKKHAEFILKGENPFTEHYSAIQAEVPNEDRSTQKNAMLLTKLWVHQTIYVAGEAGSHCVKATVEDLVKDPEIRNTQLILLSDCMSPVAGFESVASEFLHNGTEAGSFNVERAL